MDRIAKIIARSGLASRREAERWILDGRVAVDGVTLASPALTASPTQSITIDGKLLPMAEPARLWRFHKPRETMTTRSDPEGRQTIYKLLPARLKNLNPVGRLDYNSEGLLLLTNDGALKRQLELPSNKWLREYRVRIYAKPLPETIAALAKGVTIEGMRYRPIRVAIEDYSGRNGWVRVTLQEGKNREIRRVFEHFGHPVSRLIRISHGPFRLEGVESGQVMEVSKEAVAKLNVES